MARSRSWLLSPGSGSTTKSSSRSSVTEKPRRHIGGDKMSDTLVVLHTSIAIIAIVLLILAVRVDPVIALVIGTIYLGLAAGLGFEDTIGTIAQDFGDIMVEVGLLIGFGVLLGSLLLAMGALQKLVGVLLRLLGPLRGLAGCLPAGVAYIAQRASQ